MQLDADFISFQDNFVKIITPKDNTPNASAATAIEDVSYLAPAK